MEALNGWMTKNYSLTLDLQPLRMSNYFWISMFITSITGGLRPPWAIEAQLGTRPNWASNSLMFLFVNFFLTDAMNTDDCRDIRFAALFFR